MDESVVRHLEQQNEVADVLRRARALIDRPEKWCKGALSDGKRMCMLGALMMAEEGYDDGYYGANTLLRKAIGSAHAMISVFNNAPERTHVEVMDAFDRAIVLAERGEI